MIDLLSNQQGSDPHSTHGCSFFIIAISPISSVEQRTLKRVRCALLTCRHDGEFVSAVYLMPIVMTWMREITLLPPAVVLHWTRPQTRCALLRDVTRLFCKPEMWCFQGWSLITVIPAGGEDWDNTLCNETFSRREAKEAGCRLQVCLSLAAFLLQSFVYDSQSVWYATCHEVRSRIHSSRIWVPSQNQRVCVSFWRVSGHFGNCWVFVSANWPVLFNQTSDLCGMEKGWRYCFLLLFFFFQGIFFAVSKDLTIVSKSLCCETLLIASEVPQKTCLNTVLRSNLTSMKWGHCRSGGRVSCPMIKRLEVQIPLFPSPSCPSVRPLTLDFYNWGSAAHRVI